MPINTGPSTCLPPDTAYRIRTSASGYRTPTEGGRTGSLWLS
jgi:hypothetical protein